MFNVLFNYEIKSLGLYMYFIIQRIRDTFCFLKRFLALVRIAVRTDIKNTNRLDSCPIQADQTAIRTASVTAPLHLLKSFTHRSIHSKPKCKPSVDFKKASRPTSEASTDNNYYAVFSSRITLLEVTINQLRDDKLICYLSVN